MRQLRLLTWGLVPSWAKDVKVGLRTINARSESVLDKPAYARAATARRCLVPAEGWYEWQKSPTVTDRKGKPRKQPFYVRRADGDTIAFAGLYEFWRDPTVADNDDPQAWLTSFTILTTSAEPGLDRIHDRQPLVLDRSEWDAWLDPAVTDPDGGATAHAGRTPRPVRGLPHLGCGQHDRQQRAGPARPGPRRGAARRRRPHDGRGHRLVSATVRTTALELPTPEGVARAHIHRPRGARGVVALGHGAGPSITTVDMVAARDALVDAGWAVAVIEQPWLVAGGRVASPPPVLDAAWLPAVRALRGRRGALASVRGPLVLAGRSAGARVACRTATTLRARAVICLSFPLHPPGKPERCGRTSSCCRYEPGLPSLSSKANETRSAHLARSRHTSSACMPCRAPTRSRAPPPRWWGRRCASSSTG